MKRQLTIARRLWKSAGVTTIRTQEEADRLFGRGFFGPGLFAPMKIYAIALYQPRLSLKQRQQLVGYQANESKGTP